MGIYDRMPKEQLGTFESAETVGLQITTADDKLLKAIKDDPKVMDELKARLDNDEVLIDNFLKNIVHSITSKLPMAIGR